jgi:fluoride exporter
MTPADPFGSGRFFLRLPFKRRGVRVAGARAFDAVPVTSQAMRGPSSAPGRAPGGLKSIWRHPVKLYLSIAIGGAIGCLSRYVLGSFVQQHAGPDFPVGTLVINITGSFLLGAFMRYALQSGTVSVETRALLTTGFCGGYTTFSTFSYETALLIDDGEYLRAGLYVGSSVVISLLGTFIGFAAANWILSLRRAASPG